MGDFGSIEIEFIYGQWCSTSYSTFSHTLVACHVMGLQDLVLCTLNGMLVHTPMHAYACSDLLMHLHDPLMHVCGCSHAHDRALWAQMHAHI